MGLLYSLVRTFQLGAPVKLLNIVKNKKMKWRLKYSVINFTWKNRIIGKIFAELKFWAKCVEFDLQSLCRKPLVLYG